jgi:plasmid stabilization system protein ParE
MQPKPQLEWRQQAINDLVEIVGYIAEYNPEAAQALKDEIEENSEAAGSPETLQTVASREGHA